MRSDTGIEIDVSAFFGLHIWPLVYALLVSYLYITKISLCNIE